MWYTISVYIRGTIVTVDPRPLSAIYVWNFFTLFTDRGNLEDGHLDL